MFICEVCGHNFRHVRHLNEHMKVLHKKYLDQWTILTECDTLFPVPEPSLEETEKTGKGLRKFLQKVSNKFSNKIND